MKVIVVTGSPWSRYQEIFGLLSNSGVAAAQPAERSSSVSVAAWHQRALPMQDEFTAQPAPQPGRALDQVAADIFVANWDQPLWGWADHRSTWLLDYWAGFDNAFRFVLVCTPPEVAVGRAITDVSQTAVAPDRTASVWLAYHTEMMRFYHRFRDRCLLLSETEISASPKAFLASCTKSLDLPLKDTATSLAGQTEDDALGIMLARQYLDSVPEIGELWREIESSRTALPGSEVQAGASVVSTQQVIVEIGHLIRTWTTKLVSVTAAKTQAEERIVRLEQQLSAAAAECEQQKKKAEAALPRQETENLQTRLSQTEQALQQRQKALQKVEQTVEIAVRQRDMERSQTEKLQSERELILAQLNQVQEELERQFSQNKQLKKANADHDRRWEKLIRRYPDYLDFESIHILDATRTESAAAIQWRINGLFAGQRVIPQFDVATLMFGGNMALLLQRDPEQDANAPLLSWPLEAAEQNQIILQPQGSQEDLRTRWSILNGLSTTDWRVVNALCNTLATFLRNRQQSLPADLGVAQWIEQLGALREQFRSIPAAWRYDKVILRRQALNPDYEHLWFRLENVQFGDRHWPIFEFRLAASLVQPEGFSQYPKLEFPAAEEGPNQFENWFAETTDELGPRYELRFALAEQAVDMEVFNRLSPTDRLQLISIIVNLPPLLTKLETSGVKLARPWEDWKRLAMGMIEVLRLKLAQSCSTPPAVTEVEPQEAPPPATRIAVTGKSRKQTSRRR